MLMSLLDLDSRLSMQDLAPDDMIIVYLPIREFVVTDDIHERVLYVMLSALGLRQPERLAGKVEKFLEKNKAVLLIRVLTLPALCVASLAMLDVLPASWIWASAAMLVENVRLLLKCNALVLRRLTREAFRFWVRACARPSTSPSLLHTHPPTCSPVHQVPVVSVFLSGMCLIILRDGDPAACLFATMLCFFVTENVFFSDAIVSQTRIEKPGKLLPHAFVAFFIFLGWYGA